MATETTTVTQYGVARGEKLIGIGYGHPAHAQDALHSVERQMTELGLDSDVRLVEFDVETIVKTGRVRAYKEPADEAEEPAEEVAVADQPTA